MSQDARFEDGRETPLHLGAMDAEDLKVIAALTQDAVFPATEMAWLPRDRRFAILLNRFRWEDGGRMRHGAERVQSVLAIDTVVRVSSQGINRSDPDTIFSLLSIDFEAGDAGSDFILLTLAGDGAIRLEIEAVDVTLKDVTRPYSAVSGSTPDHQV